MKHFFLFALLLTGTLSMAQTTNPFPKTITVSGTAEMEVIPDEIHVNVLLREYDRKNQGKVSLDKIKQDFLNAVRAVGIHDSLVSIAAYDAYNANPWWNKKRKKEELHASITYQLKLKTSKQMDDLVDRLDDHATQNFYIQKTTHSKLEEFKKQLKMQAVRNAKEKATYLSEAINERIGEAVTIHEPTEYYTPYYNMRATATMEKMEAQSSAPADQGGVPVDFRKLKLKYDVNVVFALR